MGSDGVEWEPNGTMSKELARNTFCVTEDTRTATAIDTSRHQKRFLECFAACRSVLRAARAAKLNRQSHYWWLKEDPTYRARFEAACERVAQMLEDEAVRRAHDGVRRAVRYKGKVVGYEMEYSDRLLELLLKAHNPEKYTERSKVNLNVTGELELRARLEAGRKRAAGLVAPSPMARLTAERTDGNQLQSC